MSSLYIENYLPEVRLTGGIKTKKPVTLSGTSATLAVGGTLTVTGISTFTGAATFNGGTVNSGALTITSASANALAVGANGTTNPVLKINAATASVATGVSVTGAAAASGVTLAAISSGTDEDLTINAKGAGTLNLNASGGLTAINGVAGIATATATPAGGSTAARLLFGSTANFGVYYGSGAPTVSAAQGSLYLRSDGSSTSTRLYVNTNGTTGWTNVTTAT